MSKIVEDFDPVEWKEFLPGVYHNRIDKTEIIFRCDKEPEEEIKEVVQKAEKNSLMQSFCHDYST